MIQALSGRQTAPPPRRSILLLGLLLCTGGLFAQSGGAAANASPPEPRRLSPGEAVRLALENNLSLESGRLTLDNKQRKSDLVWNQFLPTVSVTGTLMRDNWASTSQSMRQINTPPFLEFYSIDVPQWHINGSLSVSWDFSFALVEGIRSIRMDYDAGKVTLEKARRQVERDVRKAYNQILLVDANAALLRENFTNAEQRAASAEANYRAGTAPRLTWLQAQVTVENMKPTINEMENNRKAAMAAFAMNLGLPYDTVFELNPLEGEEFYIPLDVAELISKAAAGGRPDILELQKSVQTLQSQKKAQALQAYTPFIRLSWGLSETFIKDPWKESWFNGDNWNRGGNFSMTLGLSLNSLFPFTKEGQALKDTDNALKNLNVNLAQLVWATEMEISNKVNSLEKIRTTADAQRAAVELAELSYRLTEEAYRAGMQDLSAVQNAALSLNQARLQLLTQQFNYLNDLIDLEYYIGAPFGTLSGGN